MESQEAEHFLERAKDLLELASKIKSDVHRQLLIDSAEKFLKLAMQTLGRETEH